MGARGTARAPGGEKHAARRLVWGGTLPWTESQKSVSLVQALDLSFWLVTASEMRVMDVKIWWHAVLCSTVQYNENVHFCHWLPYKMRLILVEVHFETPPPVLTIVLQYTIHLWRTRLTEMRAFRLAVAVETLDQTERYCTVQYTVFDVMEKPQARREMQFCRCRVHRLMTTC